MKPDQTARRLEQYLAEAAKAYQDAWKTVEVFREDRGKGLPAWPDWCYLPMAGIIAIVTKGAPIGVVRSQIQELSTRKIGPAALMALASWRVTMGISRFDPDLFRAVWETLLEGNLPQDLLWFIRSWKRKNSRKLKVRL
jgi:hypothetical protein